MLGLTQFKHLNSIDSGRVGNAHLTCRGTAQVVRVWSNSEILIDYLDGIKDRHQSNGTGSRHRYDGWSLDERDPNAIKAWMSLLEWLYHYYFRVQTEGWHHVPPQGKMLIVGSHNGGAASPDTFMFMYDWYRRFGCDRLAYALMHRLAWKFTPLPKTAAQFGAILAHPKMAVGALQRDAAVLVYPGGPQDMFRPHSMRHKIYFAGRKGFIKLALREEVPIVPIISYGAHDTLIVLADLHQQIQQLQKWGFPQLLDADIGVFPIYLGLPWGLALGPLPNIPLPVQMHTRVCAPIVFERYGREAASDRNYVEACYQRVHIQMQQELDDLVQRVDGRTNTELHSNLIDGY